MPNVKIRISEEDRRRLLRYGLLSAVVRDALKLYFKEEKKREFFRKLEQFQRKNPVRVDSKEIVKTIREGRRH